MNSLFVHSGCYFLKQQPILSLNLSIFILQQHMPFPIVQHPHFLNLKTCGVGSHPLHTVMMGLQDLFLLFSFENFVPKYQALMHHFYYFILPRLIQHYLFPASYTFIFVSRFLYFIHGCCSMLIVFYPIDIYRLFQCLILNKNSLFLFQRMTSRQCQQQNFRVVVRVRPLSTKQKEQISRYSQLTERNGRSSTKCKLSAVAYGFYSKYHNANISEIIRISRKGVAVLDLQYKNTEKKTREYVFSDVHDGHETNRMVFDASLRQQIASVMEGYNCTILAYGITGSGKTYSVFGHPKLEEDRGISHLAYDHIISIKQQMEKGDVHVALGFSFVEIYNENIRDLLSQDGKKIVGISEDMRGSTQLLDATQVPITSFTQISNLISLGTTKRIFASTNYNQVSSRSHAILRLSVEVSRNGQKVNSSKLHIIDLAGSEKIHMESSVRKHEGANINKSLLALGNCINALVENSKKMTTGHVPYRDSKLTRILKDSLGGNAKTIMIGCISPHPFTIQQTTTTLNYIQRAQGIQKQVIKNIHKQSPSPYSQCQYTSKGHSKQQSTPKVQPFSQSHMLMLRDQSLHIRHIFSDMLERVHLDVVENAKEGERIERMKAVIVGQNQEYEQICKDNECQMVKLKNVLFKLFEQKDKFTKYQLSAEQKSSKPECKAQRKKIVICNSAKKESGDIPEARSSRDSIGKQNKKQATPVINESPQKMTKYVGVQQSEQKQWRMSNTQAKPLSDISKDAIMMMNQSADKKYYKKSKGKFEIVKRPVNHLLLKGVASEKLVMTDYN